MLGLWLPWAEQVLRKEDSVLAAEMDAHALKLAGFDQRISVTAEGMRQGPFNRCVRYAF